MHRTTALRGYPLLAALLVLATTPALANVSLTQQIDPPEVNVGDVATVTITIQNEGSANFVLPTVDGLTLLGTSTSNQIQIENGAVSSALTKTFQLQPNRPGDFVIPAFKITLPDGGSLDVQAMKLHVLDSANGPSPVTVQPGSNSTPPSPPNPSGPVVIPPNPPPPAAPDATDNSGVHVPIDSDGRPAKVFIVITPETTDAYVGQAVPLRVEFYIRVDVHADQDSVPTIKGNEFLMNNISFIPRPDEIPLMSEVYLRYTWLTAISAPKAGDFPLQMEQDTYWNKAAIGNPFAGFMFSQSQDLAHENIPSNLLTMHIHPLPDEGRPINFTGAIGQFKVTGTAQPDAVAVGEPVTLHFEVAGQGNFDYVRSPSLTPDPNWKSYIPSFKIHYNEDDESHTHGVKAFDQSIIPQKNGTLPLPQANFSYFDPTTKQYVTVPVGLPAVTVTGTPLPASPTSTVDDSSASAPGAPPKEQFLPNRLTVGSLYPTLVPVYHRPWFWIVQLGLIALVFGSALLALFRRSPLPEDDRALRLRHQNSLQMETEAMSDAVRDRNALAFFLAARHAVQLQLGLRWRVAPEALTLAEIRQRDPALAETLEPLFRQADEIIYSGGTGADLDLPHWERHVRELLHPQPETAST